MDEKELIRLLGKLVSVESNDHTHGGRIRKLLEAGEVTVITKKWAQAYKQYTPLDLTDDRRWCTYQSCSDFDFALGKEGIVCDVTVYDGDMLDGYRTEKRFTAQLVLPFSYVHNLADLISWELKYVAGEAYERHLDEQRKAWIKKFINKF